MAFVTLTVGSNTFNGAGPGEYMLSTVLFGQPVNLIKLSPGKKANQKAPTTMAITRILEKDVTVGSEIVRRRASVNVQINIPEGFTMTEIDDLIGDVSTLATSSFLTRLALGES